MPKRASRDAAGRKAAAEEREHVETALDVRNELLLDDSSSAELSASEDDSEAGVGLQGAACMPPAAQLQAHASSRP